MQISMQKHLDKLSRQANSLLPYFVAAILLAVPLYPKFPFLSVPGVQVSIRLEDFLIFFVLLVWLLAYYKDLLQLMSNRVVQLILLFLAVGLLATISGIYLTRTVILHIGLLHWLRRVEYLSAFILGFSVIKSKTDIRFFVKVIMLVVFVAFLYGVGQKYLDVPIITTQNSEYSKGIALKYLPGGHLVSTFAGHYDLATYTILVIPLLLGLAVSDKSVLKKLNLFSNELMSRFTLLLMVFGAYWLLVNAASRISIVSYLGSVTLMMIFLKRHKLIPIILILSIILTSISSNLMDRYMRIFSVGLRRIAYVEEVYAQVEDIPEPAPVPEDRSSSIRLNVEWPRAIRAFTKNPLLGTGYSSITLATDNGYLRLLGELGALGFASLALLIGKIIHMLFEYWRHIKRQTVSSVYVLGILAAIPGVLLNMVFIDILEASKFAIMFWLLVGFAVKSVVLENEKNNS